MNLINLKELIESANFLGEEIFQNLDIDKVHEGREKEVFEQNWLESFTALESKVIPANHKNLFDSIREASFKATFNHTNDSDLAAYVCDDFELIAKLHFFNDGDAFINGVWARYKNHIFPVGEIEKIHGKIDDI